MIKDKLRDSPATGDSKFHYYLFMALIAVAAFVIGFYKIYNFDIWWHLKTGELILADGIPKTDTFSFTAYGRPWVTHEWLAQVVLYLIFRIGGLNLLIFLKGALAAVTAIILYRFAIKKDVIPPLAGVIVILATAGMAFRIFARPHLITLIFLAILVTILFDTPGSGKSFIRRRWIIIPLIMLLWANMQAGFFIGLGIYWIVTAKEVVLGKDKIKPFTKRFGKFVAPTMLATIVCFINPNGFHLFVYPALVSANPLFKNTISEWVSPLYLSWNEWLVKIALLLMLLLAAAAIILHLRKRSDISLILLIAGIASLWAMRNIPDFMIIGAAGVSATPLLAKSRKWKLWRETPLVVTLLSALAIILVFFAVRINQAQTGRLGLEIKKGFLPVGPVEFLKDAEFKGNIVNILQDGGYLIFNGYPDWKVFVDGRLLVYGQDQINNYRKVMDGQPGSLDLLDELHADAAVLPMPPKMGNLRSLLASEKGWQLVYFDDYYLIYLRKNLTNARIVSEYGYDIIDPLNSGYSSSDDVEAVQFLYEARRAFAIDSTSALSNSVLAYGYELNSDFVAAANHYKKALTINPGLETFTFRIGNAFVKAGLLDSALTWYNKAVDSEPGNAEYQYFLGLTYYVLDDTINARRHLIISNDIYPKGPAKDILQEMKNPGQ